MLIEISKIHIGGYAIIKTGRRKNGLTFRPNRLHVTTHSHELISFVSINCVNNIECYWSRSHSFQECYSLSSLGAVGSLLGAVSTTSSVVAARLTPIHLKPLRVTVVALIRFISHLNIKICKLLSLQLQNNQIGLRVVFSHLKLWVKVVRHNSNCVKI